jgi:hypothetical protein
MKGLEIEIWVLSKKNIVKADFYGSWKVFTQDLKINVFSSRGTCIKF